jgi:phytoene dehydrogenase-like protein
MRTNGKGPHYDVIVVGGGHNGLTAAAYLARAGLSVCVLERRDVLGGACVTEELWPGQRVSRASYVVSMLRPKVVADLELKRFGYQPIPLDPPFATFDADGKPILFHNDDAAARASIARVSRHDAEAMEGFNALMERMADVLRPLMLRPPPALGSKRPGDVLELLREAGRAAGLARRELQELYRFMTMSVGDLLDDWFENDALKGSYASTGVVGVWAGPRTPGTAYNLLHHELGELDGVSGAWGTCAAAWARSARRSRRARRPRVRPSARARPSRASRSVTAASPA